MTCPTCKTEIEPRRILFGKAGKIEVSACECEASRLTLKYENSEFKEPVDTRESL